MQGENVGPEGCDVLGRRPAPRRPVRPMGDRLLDAGQHAAEIERLKKEDISDEELTMIKTRTKANLIRGLGENEGLATQLAIYQMRYGDWRELFRSVDRIDKVTKADIRRVANQTFLVTNRTIGVIETSSAKGQSEQGSERAPSQQDPSNQNPAEQYPPGRYSSEQGSPDQGAAQ